MRKVLLTGASGFIGRHFVSKLCARDVDVCCLVRKTSNRTPLEVAGCRFVEGDILDRESVGDAIKQVRPDVIYHLAGLTKAIDPKRLYEVNQRGAENLLVACSQISSPPTVLMVSTLAVAGPSETYPKRETDYPKPVSHYGRSKLAAEQEAFRFSDRVPVSIVRPPIVFGPHDRDTFEMFKTIAAVGLHPVPTLRQVRVSWIHVDDLCEAMLCAAEKGQRLPADFGQSDSEAKLQTGQRGAGIYFTTSDEIVGYAELGRSIARALGNRFFLPIPSPSPAIWGLASIYEGIARVTGTQKILNFDKAREATAGSWICDGEKLTKELGFSCEMTLDETVRSSAAWYREAGWL